MPRAAEREKAWRQWRRRDLNQNLVDELAQLFREGATVKIAAGKVGLPPGVLRMWLREGEKQLSDIYEADTGYPENEGMLYVECAKATAEYLGRKVSTIDDPQGADWRAQSWLLERRDEDFNPAAKVDIQTHKTVEVELNDPALIAAELAALGFVIPQSQAELQSAWPDTEAADGALSALPAGPESS